jgi:hypothetical protein
MKGNLSMWLVVALIASGTSLRTAQAQSVMTVDPGTFAPGTNVTGAYAGVTLLSFSLNDVIGTAPNGLPLYAASYGSVYAVNPGLAAPGFTGAVFSATPASSDTYFNMLGGIDGSCFSACAPPDRPDMFGTNLLVEFASPVSSVSILDVGNVNNGVYMEAFNSSNQIVGDCVTDVGFIQPSGNYGCYSVLNNGFSDSGGYTQETSIQSSNSVGISKILIGGDGDVSNISTIKYTTVSAPEIDPTSVTGGLSLLLGGLLVLRGRRPMKLGSATVQ